MNADAVIRAAGAVLWRQQASGPEIALVHRPRYDDWSLPKGKLLAGETELLGAVREVGEETGARVSVQRALGRLRYDAAGTGKVVRYWSMRYLEGAFQPGEEVDELRWLPPDRAERLLSYGRDREPLRRCLEHLCAVPILVVRHASAGNREDWHDRDSLRPLDGEGRRQALQIADFAEVFRPVTLAAAPLLRCTQTLEPLASRLGVETAAQQALSEGHHEQHPEAAAALVRRLGEAGHSAVLCSQGGVIPDLVRALSGRDRTRTRKGGIWNLCFDKGELVDLQYTPDPGAIDVD